MANIGSLLGKKEEVFGFKTLYREIGYYISRLEQYERALHFFDEAIKKTPNDQRALMGRAYARSKVNKYKGALEDIQTALKLDPDDLAMLAPKALNTYLSCEFEEGLIQNTRLIPKRKKPDYFTIGAMECADAIENCLGERVGKPLRDHYMIIRALAWKKNVEERKTYVPYGKFNEKKKKKQQIHKFVLNEPVEPKKSRIMQMSTHSRFSNLNEQFPSGIINIFKDQTASSTSTLKSGGGAGAGAVNVRDSIYTVKSEPNVIPPFKPYPFRPLQAYTSNIENYLAEIYLDTLYKDKIFLKQLPKRSGIISPNKEGMDKIIQIAKSGYKTVKYKQELLRARRPLYFIKYQEAKVSGTLRDRQAKEETRIRDATTKEANALVEKMRDALCNLKWKLVLETSDKLKNYCETKSKKYLPRRDDYMFIIYDTVCQAHYDMKRLNDRQYKWDQEKRIHTMLGLQLSREPSTDSVIIQLKNQLVDWKKQISVYEDKLRKSTIPMEMAYLYHELSRFHSELKQYELSRVYARKCITEAARCDDSRWVINALLLTIKANIMQHNKNEAKRDCQEAIQVANNRRDIVAKGFFEQCYKVVEEVEFDDVLGPKVLQKREQKIVRMMADDMRNEAAHLFRMISAMPAARRISVMPGVKLEDEDGKVNRRASIMPAGNKNTNDLQASQTSKKAKIKMLNKPTDSNKGVGFINLIQYHLE